MNYRTIALLFLGLAGVLAAIYAVLLYHGAVLTNAAGMSTGGVEPIIGKVIWIACAVPFVLLTAMAFGFRKQLANGVEQGLG